jgi:hypothetical protein
LRGDGVLVLLLDEVAVAQLVQRERERGAAVAELLEVVERALGGPGLGVAVDEIQQRLALHVERLLGIHAGQGLAGGGRLEEDDGVGVPGLVHADPAHLVARQVMHRRGGLGEDGRVVLLGLGQVRLVEEVVAEDLLGLQAQGTGGVLARQLPQRLEHLVELAQLALLVRQVERDFVPVVEVRVLAQQAVVHLHRLVLQQPRLRRDDGAAGPLRPGLGLEVIHVAALLHVQLGQAELQVRQVRGVAALGDEALRLADGAVHLEDVALEPGDQLLALLRLGDDGVEGALGARGAGRGGGEQRRGEQAAEGAAHGVSSMQRLSMRTR